MSISHLIKNDNINDVVQPISILLRASTLDLINIIYIFSYYEESIRLKDINDNYKFVAFQLYLKQYENLKSDYEFEKEILRLSTNPDSNKKEKINLEIKKYDASISEVENIIQNYNNLLIKLHLGDNYDRKVVFSSRNQIKQYCKQESFYKYNNLYHFYTKYSKIDHFGAITKSIEQFSSKEILHDIIWLSINFSQGFIYNLKMIEDEKFELTFSNLKIISENLAKYGYEKLYF